MYSYLSESCRLNKRPSCFDASKMIFYTENVNFVTSLSYRHVNLPAIYGFFGCCAFKRDRLQPTNFSEDTPTRRHLPADRRHFPGTASLLTKSYESSFRMRLPGAWIERPNILLSLAEKVVFSLAFSCVCTLVC